MNIQLFMHSPFNGHLACFHLGTIMNKSAISMFVNVEKFLMVKKRNHVLRHYGRLWNLAHLLRFGSNMSPEPRSFLPPQWVSVILTSAHPCPYLVFLHYLIWKRKWQWTILEVPFEKKLLHIYFSVNVYAYVCLCKRNCSMYFVSLIDNFVYSWISV